MIDFYGLLEGSGYDQIDRLLFQVIYNNTWVDYDTDYDTAVFMLIFSEAVAWNIILPNELAWGETHREEFYALLRQRMINMVK